MWGDMSIIDRQRIAAVRKLVDMGYLFRDGEWMAPPMGWPSPATFEADAMHALLVLRADAIEGCAENSDELAMIAETIAAYEAKRWPGGKG